jgi:hypothetical protein
VPDVHIRTLIRAAQIVGGPEALALRLNVTPSHLALWMSGAEPCPPNIFLRAVDLVLERANQPPRGQSGPVPGDESDDSEDLPRGGR